MRRGTAKKHAPESGLIGSVCHSGGALLASSKAPKRTSRAAWSGISLLPKLAMRSMLRRGKKRRPRVKDYVGAIDQGPTSTRFMAFDQGGRAVAVAQQEHEQIYPKPGWVEHDPQEILRRTEDVIADALGQRGLHASDLAAIGITNQRETTVVWDCKTGKPVAHAIVWQDTRVADDVKRFSATGGQERFRPETGLPLSTYFSGLKLRWLLENVPGARAKAAAGELLFGNVDTFLLWNLTGGARGGVHATDVTNASRTQLLNRSEEHTSELQSRLHLVCRLLLEKKKKLNLPRHRRFRVRDFHGQHPQQIHRDRHAFRVPENYPYSIRDPTLVITLACRRAVNVD